MSTLNKLLIMNILLTMFYNLFLLKDIYKHLLSLNVTHHNFNCLQSVALCVSQFSQFPMLHK